CAMDTSSSTPSATPTAVTQRCLIRSMLSSLGVPASLPVRHTACARRGRRLFSLCRVGPRLAVIVSPTLENGQTWITGEAVVAERPAALHKRCTSKRRDGSHVHARFAQSAVHGCRR